MQNQGGPKILDSGNEWIADLTAATLTANRRQMTKRPRLNQGLEAVMDLGACVIHPSSNEHLSQALSV